MPAVPNGETTGARVPVCRLAWPRPMEEPKAKPDVFHGGRAIFLLANRPRGACGRRIDK